MDEVIGKDLKGEFWLPADPTQKWLGTLKFQPRYHGVLELQQIAGSASDLGDEIPVLHGCLTNHYGYDVTLYNVLVTGKQSYVQRPGYDLFSCATNRVLFGGRYGPETDENIFGIQLKISGLTSWCDSSGFDGEVRWTNPSERVAEVSYRTAPSLEVPLSAGKRLRFSTILSGPIFFKNVKNVDIAEHDYIEILFVQPISIEAARGEELVWQSFLGLALRRASYIQELRLQMGDDPKGQFRHILFEPGSEPNDKAPVGRREALFLRSTLGADVGKIVAGWSILYDKAVKAIQLFAGVDYQNDAYYSARLLSYLQALEVLHRELNPDVSPFPTIEVWHETLKVLREALPKTLDTKLRSDLSNSLGFFGQMTLVQRLLAFYDQCPSTIGPLFPDREEDMKFLKDVRNYLTHYGDSKAVSADFFISRFAMILTLKCRLFMEIALLSALGLSDETIRTIVQRCQEYEWLRREPHRLGET